MPSHPDRVRTAPLPKDYRFGDARAAELDRTILHAIELVKERFRRSIQAAIELERHVHDTVRFDPLRNQFVCVCGARLDLDHTVIALPWRAPHDNAAEQLARRGDWNVIEGEHFDSDAERHPVIEGARSDA